MVVEVKNEKDVFPVGSLACRLSDVGQHEQHPARTVGSDFWSDQRYDVLSDSHHEYESWRSNRCLGILAPYFSDGYR
jgi:hypothetical protein